MPNSMYLERIKKVTVIYKVCGTCDKNVHGGLNHRKFEPKTITHFEEKENDRCLVKLFSLYMSLISCKGPFYRKPLPNTANLK